MSEAQLHILSIDLEEWFQVSSFKQIYPESQWETLEKRLPQQTELLLSILEKYQTKATFFIVGWIAERYADTIKAIVKAGHEIASHSYLHTILPNLGPDKFKKDLEKSKEVLQEIADDNVIGYRAPSWSLNSDSRWAIDIMKDSGFVYDSSIFPVSLRYGQSKTPRFSYQFENGLWEFPLSTFRLANVNIPVGGGAFLRAEPLMLTSLAIKQYEKNKQPFVLYLHPWELDPHHPRVKAGIKTWFIHYYNIPTTLPKLEWLLLKYSFTNFRDFINTNRLSN